VDPVLTPVGQPVGRRSRCRRPPRRSRPARRRPRGRSLRWAATGARWPLVGGRQIVPPAPTTTRAKGSDRAADHSARRWCPARGEGAGARREHGSGPVTRWRQRELRSCDGWGLGDVAHRSTRARASRRRCPPRASRRRLRYPGAKLLARAGPVRAIGRGATVPRSADHDPGVGASPPPQLETRVGGGRGPAGTVGRGHHRRRTRSPRTCRPSHPQRLDGARALRSTWRRRGSAAAGAGHELPGAVGDIAQPQTVGRPSSSRAVRT
jgi:hypothetical protein